MASYKCINCGFSTKDYRRLVEHSYKEHRN